MPGVTRPKWRREEHADSQHRGARHSGWGHGDGVWRPADSAGARAALGWVPQELALYPKLTCRENLGAFGQYYGLRGAALQQAIEWCLGWAALTDRAHEPVQNLSGGMKRRPEYGRGTDPPSESDLMDEPTVGVDPQSRNRIFEMIETLHAEGVSMIYTTHYMEEAERLCNRIAIVDHGRIIALGTRMSW